MKKTIQIICFALFLTNLNAQDYLALQPFSVPTELNPALTGVMKSNARFTSNSIVKNYFTDYYSSYYYPYGGSQYAASNHKICFDMPIALDSLGSFIGVGMSVGGFLENAQYPTNYIKNQPDFKLDELPIKLQASYIKAFNKRSILSFGVSAGIIEYLVIGTTDRQFDPITQEVQPVDFSKVAYYKGGTMLGGGISFIQKIRQKSSIGLGASINSVAFPGNYTGLVLQELTFHLNNEIALSNKFSLKPAAVYRTSYFIQSNLNVSLGLKFNFNEHTSLSLQPALFIADNYYYRRAYPNFFSTGLYFQTKRFAVGATYIFPNLSLNLETKYPSFGVNAQYNLYNAKPTVGIDPF